MSRQLYVFGSNGEGQLGIPAADIISTPTLVPDTIPLDDLKSIQCGDNHTLLQISNTNIYAAGSNRKGQIAPCQTLGDNTRVEQFQRLVTGGSFVAATCESYAYISVNLQPPAWIANMLFEASQIPAQLESSEPEKTFRPFTAVWTHGFGQWGELGRGARCTSTNGDPPLLDALRNKLWGIAVGFAAGVWHYVVILEDGSIYGWGKARQGQLGDKLEGRIMEPTKIEGVPFKPKKVVCGKDFTYLVGDPSTGEHAVLGKDKFGIVSSKPENVKGWKDIGATWHAIFVLLDDGRLVAWGKENMWQLLPPGLPLLGKIAIGSDHVLALTQDGKLISWGWGKHGNCGDLTKIRHDLQNDMLSGLWNDIEIPGTVEMIAAGYCTSFVVTSRNSKEKDISDADSG